MNCRKFYNENEGLKALKRRVIVHPVFQTVESEGQPEDRDRKMWD